MKSDHRHELKTNELAEWIAHFPQWVKENRITIIGVSAAIVVVVVVYIWFVYNKNVVAVRRQFRFTNLINQLRYNKVQILQAQEQGRDISFILLQPAENLESFAKQTKDSQMAALALIKRAEALRMELHYRLGDVSMQELIEQIELAKASYAEALQKASHNSSLIALAKFGLGLCEEELSNFDKAQQIYRDIAMDSALDGTTAQDAAKYRLETMADYKGEVTFMPSSKPDLIATYEPQVIDLGPIEANLPNDSNLTEGDASAPTVQSSITEAEDVNNEHQSLDDTGSVTESNLPAK
jgi:hypothetical protein